jgi:dihydropteroate synthase
VPALWRFRGGSLDLAERVRVMGVVNVTPDSFSDGGRFLDPGAAIARARTLVDEGADLLDFGAESTRPGAAPVPADVQLARLMPVVAAIAADHAVPISVDTGRAAVAARAIEAGAAIVNDVTALRDRGMAELIAGTGAGVVLMHLRGTPATMQDDPRYDDVARDVAAWLEVRLRSARRAGIAAEQVVLDPGIGFGKTAAHNFELLARFEELHALGRPLLVGLSRKSFLGRGKGLPPDERLEGGLAATAIAVFLGARVIRTHDVAATVRAVRIAEEIATRRRAAIERAREF